ncbi:DUF4249 family protein [Flagellimonas allohymeniacidonis]|uniref:DUF4249 family protein n=1 Tax=Flagellimonas allohymeniacidonis TaxID=2517819 RepID=A0A4Q8QH01_9FLAO|nr:DUF4249 family protein [Allomuricauda hymeniacidonis]
MNKLLTLIAICLLSFSCEDVVQIDVPSEDPRLIVNAVLRVDESEEFVPVEVSVTETSAFFGETPVTNVESAVIFYGVPLEDQPDLFESIFVSNLTEVDPGSGILVPDPNFSGDQRIRTQNVTPNTDFILLITFQDREYAARTTYQQAVPFDDVRQGDEILFDEDDIEIEITITDTPDVRNFYILDFDFGEFLALDDEFFDGQQFQFSYFYEQDLQPGSEVEISILGADQDFFNYVDLIVEQTQDDGGVFETPAATVRGNIFDVTDLDNIFVFDNVQQPEVFPLGYFAVVQEFRQTLTIE